MKKTEQDRIEPKLSIPKTTKSKGLAKLLAKKRSKAHGEHEDGGQGPAELTPEAVAIVAEVLDYMALTDPDFSHWSVGLTDNPRKRLFEDHGVRETVDNWIYRTADTAVHAREVQLYLMQKGMSGDDVRSGALSVYAYRRSPFTRP